MGETDLVWVIWQVDGGNLSYIIGEPLSELATKFYVASVALIVEALHAKGIACRDVKPENLLLDLDGYVKMVDLGFAKVTRSHPCSVGCFSLCNTPLHALSLAVYSRLHTTLHTTSLPGDAPPLVGALRYSRLHTTLHTTSLPGDAPPFVDALRYSRLHATLHTTHPGDAWPLVDALRYSRLYRSRDAAASTPFLPSGLVGGRCPIEPLLLLLAARYSILQAAHRLLAYSPRA